MTRVVSTFLMKSKIQKVMQNMSITGLGSLGLVDQVYVSGLSFLLSCIYVVLLMEMQT